MSELKKCFKTSEASTTCESLLTTSDMFYGQESRVRDLPGKLMAQRATLRRRPEPVSLANYAKEILHSTRGYIAEGDELSRTRDPPVPKSLYHRSIDLKEVQRILSAADEADRASEGFISKPLPSRPKLREVLRGPQFRPPGTQNYIERMSQHRKKQEIAEDWRRKVDGKGIRDDAGELWHNIVRGRWKELDAMLDEDTVA